MIHDEDLAALAIEVRERAAELSALLVGGVELPRDVAARLTGALLDARAALEVAGLEVCEAGPLGVRPLRGTARC
jgi:hypothetical protein